MGLMVLLSVIFVVIMAGAGLTWAMAQEKGLVGYSVGLVIGVIITFTAVAAGNSG